MRLQRTSTGPVIAEGVRSAAAGMRRRGAAPAFTLVEILITLSLLVLLASLAWPAMQAQITASELPESAERIRSALAMARCEAVMQHRRFRIRFAPEEQQPKIEEEVDPINQPGVYTAATADWASEEILLANVQVHDIQTGRPVYMQALSMTTDPDAALKQYEKAEEEKRDREQLRTGMGKGADDNTELDPLRPVITFEPDGSTEWATLILARVKSKDTLEEEQPQIWVVLDGRTGLALVHPKVTKEQLADSNFYVQREKLELPDTVDIDELSFNKIEGQQADSSSTGTGQSDLNTQGGTNDALSQLQQVATEVKGQGEVSEKVTPGESGDTASQLEGALDKSTLTEEEKNNIRSGFHGKTK